MPTATIQRVRGAVAERVVAASHSSANVRAGAPGTWLCPGAGAAPGTEMMRGLFCLTVGCRLLVELAAGRHRQDDGRRGRRRQRGRRRFFDLLRGRRGRQDPQTRGRSAAKYAAHFGWNVTSSPFGQAADFSRCMIMVPAPCSVNSSISSTCWMRPSRMTAARTPRSTASMQVSTLGIIPPEIVPSAIRARASVVVSRSIKLPLRSMTPGTSVSSSMRSACRAPATAPATVSALML